MKKIWKICITIVVAVTAVIGACLFLLRGKSFDPGVILKTERGILWLTEEGAPVELRFASGCPPSSPPSRAAGSAPPRRRSCGV